MGAVSPTLSETRKAIADYENQGGLGNAFVTALPHNPIVTLGALALAPDHNELQHMKIVTIASLSAGMPCALTSKIEKLLDTEAKPLGGYAINLEASGALSAEFKGKVAGQGGGAGLNNDTASSLQLIVQDRHLEQIDDGRVADMLPFCTNNLDCNKLANFLPQGATECYAYLINRVFKCREVYIDVSSMSATSVGLDAAAQGVDCSARVSRQKSARAQVLHQFNGNLFAYGFTYKKVRMQKKIGRAAAGCKAAADAAARFFEQLEQDDADTDTAVLAPAMSEHQGVGAWRKLAPAMSKHQGFRPSSGAMAASSGPWLPLGGMQEDEDEVFWCISLVQPDIP